MWFEKRDGRYVIKIYSVKNNGHLFVHAEPERGEVFINNEKIKDYKMAKVIAVMEAVVRSSLNANRDKADFYWLWRRANEKRFPALLNTFTEFMRERGYNEPFDFEKVLNKLR